MKKAKEIIRTVLILAICCAVLCSSALADTGAYTGDFPDVPATAPYAEAVETLYDMGIFNGDKNGNFNPDSTITRAESAAVICRLMGAEDEAKAMTKQVFDDVPASHWAVGYVAKATELGIINGYGNGKFGPSDPVTYEQMVKMLVCSLGYDKAAKAEGGYPNGFLSVAEKLGITQDIEITVGTGAPRKMIAILCYNSTLATSFEPL